jgi:hypothetical protein
LKIVNGITLILVWSVIAVIALTLMITFYCGRECGLFFGRKVSYLRRKWAKLGIGMVILFC